MMLLYVLSDSVLFPSRTKHCSACQLMQPTVIVLVVVAAAVENMYCYSDAIAKLLQ